MLPLLIVVLVAQGAILGLFAFYVSKTKADPTQEPNWVGPLAEIETRMEQLEIKWLATRDHLLETMETGQEAWRKVRAREGVQKRKAKLEEESEDDMGPHPDQMDLLPGPEVDPRGSGYGEQGADPPWKQAARAIAQSYLGGGNA